MTYKQRLVNDDDGHYYVIPADHRDTFNRWVELSVGEGYNGPDFDKYRLNMHPSNYTFVGWREDR